MNKLRQFLTAAYRSQVLGVRANLDQLFEQFANDPEFMRAARDEVGRIRELGKDAAGRDFPGYKGAQVLESALERWRGHDAVAEGQ